MRRGSVAGLVLLLLATCAVTNASEPVGSAAIRYEWMGEAAEAGGERTLRVSITALVSLDDLKLQATVPSKTSPVRRLRVESTSPGAAIDTPWTDDGVELPHLGAGESIVLELGVVEPASGGEILSLVVLGRGAAAPVREAIGVPIGLPGTPPVLRNGAVEYPAARVNPTP